MTPRRFPEPPPPRMYPEPPGGIRYRRARDARAARERAELRENLEHACAADDLARALACEDLLAQHGLPARDRRTCARCRSWADHTHHPRPRPGSWDTVLGQAGHMRAGQIRDALNVFDIAATATVWTPCPGGAFAEIDYAGTIFTVYLADHAEEPLCGAVFIVDRTRDGQREHTPALCVWLDERATAISDAYHNSPPAPKPPAGQSDYL